MYPTAACFPKFFRLPKTHSITAPDRTTYRNASFHLEALQATHKLKNWNVYSNKTIHHPKDHNKRLPKEIKAWRDHMEA